MDREEAENLKGNLSPVLSKIPGVWGIGIEPQGIDFKVVVYVSDDLFLEVRVTPPFVVKEC